MIIYPAIDIRNGNCVRLLNGDYDKETIYSDSPMQMAKTFEAKGAAYLHMVDLDGAKDGESENVKIVMNVAKTLGIPVQFGGGIRSLDKIDRLIDAGVSRVILGTSAVKNKQLVIEAVQKHGAKIAVGIDAKDGYVAIDGWLETSEFKAIEFAKMMEEIGVKTIIYTDISRDGTLRGPNLQAMEEMAKAVSCAVIASGGVGKMKDVIALKSTGVAGVIIGKAIYTDAVQLEEAIVAAKED